MGTFRTVGQLAALQHGVVSRRQAAQLGCDRTAVERWERLGRIDLPSPAVVRFNGAPETGLQRVSAAVLDAGQAAVASHGTAAWLWRLSGFDTRCLDVTVLRGDDTRRSRLARLHRPRLLMPHHVTRIENIPVTSLGRTIFDLAGERASLRRLDRLVNTVVGR